MVICSYWTDWGYTVVYTNNMDEEVRWLKGWPRLWWLTRDRIKKRAAYGLYHGVAGFSLLPANSLSCRLGDAYGCAIPSNLGPGWPS